MTAEAGTEEKKCALVISFHPDCQRYSSVCSVTFCVSANYMPNEN